MLDFETEGAPSCVDREHRAKRLDPLVRYMIFHWALGALGGALLVTALLDLIPWVFGRSSTTAVSAFLRSPCSTSAS